ncbi:bifunctional 4-hydroxy-2-oxoglutarate aldolase/2-dehydro-3-deoxy-phosphogluconate aldolase [Methylotuvimicrobium sp. KM1]|uniref:bifunctional 4-hydroxy-2-oxoglutarate aldolase/2-dehydro-3-deoxy-phosphogluconate aldolase n=1 Tax=Methylotuvimicrobium sp. KM1 TaxID=3377707 RepID=UPI00384E5B97
MTQNNWKLQPSAVLNAGPVMPVMVIKNLEDAVPLAKALTEGGIKVLEITLRTPIALDAIRLISEQVKDAIVGVGTVTNPEQLRAAEDAGAVFAISPGLTPTLLKAATNSNIALIPGISTISELMLGMEYGLDHFKFFPAAAAGGVNMLKGIAGPIPSVTFCPTGGISASNYNEYLSLPNVACVGGSWLAPDDAVAAKDWPRITELAKTAIENAVKK